MIILARRFCPPGNGDGAFGSDEDLTRLLPENCRGGFESFKAAYDEMFELAQTEAFADGLSLGLRLGFESLGRDTERRKDGVK